MIEGNAFESESPQKLGKIVKSVIEGRNCRVVNRFDSGWVNCYLERVKYFAKPSFVAASFLLAAATSQAAVLVDFNTAGQLAGQFRGGNLPTAYVQTATVLNFTQGTGAASTLFYDANGSAAGVSAFNVSIGNPLTVTASVTLPANNGSFGIFFANPSDDTKSYMALFNVNYTGGDGTSDQFRFDNAFNAATGGVVSLGGGTTGDAGITTGSAFNISVTYTILSANSYRLSMTVGNITIDSTDFSGTPLSQVQVGIRTNPTGSNTGTLDNFTISGDPITVPEASSAMLVLAGACGMLGRRKR